MQPFLISSFEGLKTYTKPYLTPENAFVELDNCYIFRGVLQSRKGTAKIFAMSYFQKIDMANKISGNFAIEMLGREQETSLLKIYSSDWQLLAYQKSSSRGTPLSGVSSLFSSGSYDKDTHTLSLTFTTPQQQLYVAYSVGLPIRGLIPFVDVIQNNNGMLVIDDNRICIETGGDVQALEDMKTVAVVFDGSQKTFTANLGFQGAIDTSTLKVQIGNTIIQANAAGTFPTQSGITLTYDANTGILSGTMTTAPSSGSGAIVTAKFKDNADLFHGKGKSISWSQSRDKIYFTNGIDRITVFDILTRTLSQPKFTIDTFSQTSQNQIATCQFLAFFKNRLLLLAPTLENTKLNGLEPQTVRWSAPYLEDNTNLSFQNFDDVGLGGEITPDITHKAIALQSCGDSMLVFYSNSVFSLSYTGDANNPFYLESIDQNRTHTSPQGTLNYKQSVFSVGDMGLTICDGLTLERYDEDIPEFFRKMNFKFAERFFSVLNLKADQLMMFFTSNDQEEVQENNQALVYSLSQNNFAGYSFLNQFSSSALRQNFEAKTWLKNFPEITWEEANFTWNAFVNDDFVHNLVLGSASGGVFEFDGYLDEYIDREPEPVRFSAKSGFWNPYLDKGLNWRLSSLELYYECVKPCEVKFEFFANGSSVPSREILVNLDGENGNQYFKKILVNLSGQFIQMRISSTEKTQECPIKILGMILWGDPAGDIKGI